jgi:hypothetical protein
VRRFYDDVADRVESAFEESLPKNTAPPKTGRAGKIEVGVGVVGVGVAVGLVGVLML